MNLNLLVTSRLPSPREGRMRRTTIPTSQKKSCRINHESLKCLGCVCGIENQDGIWCARLKKVPTSKQTGDCRSFAPRNDFFRHHGSRGKRGLRRQQPRRNLRLTNQAIYSASLFPNHHTDRELENVYHMQACEADELRDPRQLPQTAEETCWEEEPLRERRAVACLSPPRPDEEDLEPLRPISPKDIRTLLYRVGSLRFGLDELTPPLIKAASRIRVR